jgi:phytanoyl-CoA hydroxylase
MTTTTALSTEQLDAFRRDGFLVLEGFVDPRSCAALRERALAVAAEVVPDPRTATIFTADGEQRHGADAYFLESGDKIRCFFEKDAFDADGDLRGPAHLSLNKLGHAMHDLDPVFEAFSRTDDLARVSEEIGFTDPLLLQSMYIFKQPRIGGEVLCHQDSTFLHTEPLSCVGFWLALEDATEENGCMWAEPGGHRRPLRQRFVRDGATTRMVTLDPAPLPTEGLVPLPARKGTLVLLHGQLPHRSGPNRSDQSRHAYALQLINGAARYSPDNWLRRSADLPLRGF